MRRSLIIGPCGSGKSTLARELAPLLGLPLVHMDQLGWQAGWFETEKPELKARLAEVVARDEWLIEGNYGSTLGPRLERADTVIYLDFPITLCLSRLTRRIINHRGRSRPLAARYARRLPRTLRSCLLLVCHELEYRPAPAHRGEAGNLSRPCNPSHEPARACSLAARQ
jgi:adenylate kinase family enzyme